MNYNELVEMSHDNPKRICNKAVDQVIVLLLPEKFIHQFNFSGSCLENTPSRKIKFLERHLPEKRKVQILWKVSFLEDVNSRKKGGPKYTYLKRQ